MKKGVAPEVDLFQLLAYGRFCQLGTTGKFKNLRVGHGLEKELKRGDQFHRAHTDTLHFSNLRAKLMNN